MPTRLLLFFLLAMPFAALAQSGHAFLGVWRGPMKDSIASFNYTVRIESVENGEVNGVGLSGNQSQFCETILKGTIANGILTLRETGIRFTNYRSRDLICLLGMEVRLENKTLVGRFFPVSNQALCLPGTARLQFVQPPDTTVTTAKPSLMPPQQKPPAYTNRQLTLIKEIVVDADGADLQVFDNGVIDGDSITLTDNNREIFSKAMLSATPLKHHIDNKDTGTHTISFVAENLGSIPPNTGLLVITANRQRWEINFSSDMVKTSYVRIVLRK